MSQHEHNSDQEFDEFLREVGPHVPQPELDLIARSRLLEAAAGVNPVPVPQESIGVRRWATWTAVTGASLAAVFGIACIVMWTNMLQTRDQLAESQWETGEAIQLLTRARQTQPLISAPAQVDGIRSEDLALITFHHDLCPIAQGCTPRFKELQARHHGERPRFITFDVTGSDRDSAEKEIAFLGMEFALLGPLGAETGVVKVLDTAHKKVLCSAPGLKGIQQAESLLARVLDAELRQ